VSALRSAAVAARWRGSPAQPCREERSESGLEVAARRHHLVVVRRSQRGFLDAFDEALEGLEVPFAQPVRLGKELARILEAAEERVLAERKRPLRLVEHLQNDDVVASVVEEAESFLEALERHEEVGDKHEQRAMRDLVRYALEHLGEARFAARLGALSLAAMLARAVRFAAGGTNARTSSSKTASPTASR